MDLKSTEKYIDDSIMTGYDRPISSTDGANSPVSDPENLAHFSVTTALSYCKTKILKPYLRVLNVTGLRSFSNDQSESITFSDCCSFLYMSFLLLLIISGYVLQYMACFRRDRGFGYLVLENKYSMRSDKLNKMYENVCKDSVIFSYAIPHVMHLLGYVYAFIIFRSSDDDQLPNLMETVFLSLSDLSNGFQSQKKLIKTLWVFVGVSIVWMIFSLTTVIIMMGEGIIDFKWLTEADPMVIVVMKILLVTSTLWQDVIQATVISNYCLQAQLLLSYMNFLRDKLTQNLVQPLEWMKDVEDFKRLLRFLNNKLSPSVCLFTLTNLCRGVTGCFWLLNLDRINNNSSNSACWIAVTIVNVSLWILLSLAPFIQAARLSTSCETICSVGHEVRVRPFAHQETPTNKLDSLMIYSSNLKMSAKLFGMPIKTHYLYLLLFIFVMIVIVLGQLHYFPRKV